MHVRALFFALALSSTAHAGAWTLPAGDGLFIAQASYFSSDRYFDADGNRQRQPTFRKYELQPYAEYGVKDWLTVGGSAYAQRVSQSDNDNYGLADTELFARVRLWQPENAVLSIQPLVKLPSRFGESGLPRGGSRSTDMELNLLYGTAGTYWGMPYYTDMRVGYRTRSRDLSPQWRTDLAIGVMVSEHWQIIPALRSVIATDAPENITFREDGEQDYDLAKAELTVAYHLGAKRWVQATAFDHVAGIQTGAGRGFALGFAQRF
jgi:hypothetical protein